MPKKRTAEVLEKGSDDEAEIEETKVKDVDDSSHWTREEIIQIPLPTGAKNLKIMSWNVNGLKALVTTKKTTLQTLIDNRQPDVLCLQVTIRTSFVYMFNISAISHYYRYNRKLKFKIQLSESLMAYWTVMMPIGTVQQ